ncbi:hypothetical protein KI123_002883, partial [Enterococcus faecalis]|nr:hypothetical protein [Enterococcus faecalis]
PEQPEQPEQPKQPEQPEQHLKKDEIFKENKRNLNIILMTILLTICSFLGTSIISDFKILYWYKKRKGL